MPSMTKKSVTTAFCLDGPWTTTIRSSLNP
uniref:Uncharacterized protein n=1 Tax=Anguilla anguilla TaxID=7936 RepID=A0A0E9RMM9_ANGAN